MLMVQDCVALVVYYLGVPAVSLEAFVHLMLVAGWAY